MSLNPPPEVLEALERGDAWVYALYERDRWGNPLRARYWVFRERDHRPPVGAVLIARPRPHEPR